MYDILEALAYARKMASFALPTLHIRLLRHQLQSFLEKDNARYSFWDLTESHIGHAFSPAASR